MHYKRRGGTLITLYARDADEVFSPSSQLLRYSQGTSIYHEGDPARYWYEVVTGIVRTCRFHADGHRQLTGFFYADDVFGVEGENYRESAEAVTSTTLRRHPKHELTAGEGADGADQPERALQRALDSARQCIFLLGHRTAADRLAAFLITIAERLGASDGMQLPMTRTDIADHLGLTIHTVSRTISELVRRGLIALEGPQRVRILDLRGLQTLAGEEDNADLGWMARCAPPLWRGSEGLRESA
jgi:CRP/FNR family nitrogen fixation transcriptional regulator